jgi:hypothetical protein
VQTSGTVATLGTRRGAAEAFCCGRAARGQDKRCGTRAAPGRSGSASRTQDRQPSPPIGGVRGDRRRRTRRKLLALQALDIEFVLFPAPVEAYRLARTHRRSVYDSLYLAVAQSQQIALWTGNRRLCNAVRPSLPFVEWIGDYASSPLRPITLNCAVSSTYPTSPIAQPCRAAQNASQCCSGTVTTNRLAVSA